ncbi:hypothetical protein K402DRAFT_464701 [Aulographum hederae CBS 113979]|uniref:Glutaredoxin domain-containing protein n=1 Tax=Aulographum hederae CBS 113979 TaxID=1176131 RepID=A0A6G1GVS3_9PEZI|nr:hypothetical protein K402DRAFT_464701 [Aulographum hederae CBS 113979]
MPSGGPLHFRRRLKIVGLLVLLAFIITLYISSSARQTRSSEFYSRTKDALRQKHGAQQPLQQHQQEDLSGDARIREEARVAAAEKAKARAKEQVEGMMPKPGASDDEEESQGAREEIEEKPETREEQLDREKITKQSLQNAADEAKRKANEKADFRNLKGDWKEEVKKDKAKSDREEAEKDGGHQHGVGSLGEADVEDEVKAPEKKTKKGETGDEDAEKPSKKAKADKEEGGKSVAGRKTMGDKKDKGDKIVEKVVKEGEKVVDGVAKEGANVEKGLKDKVQPIEEKSTKEKGEKSVKPDGPAKGAKGDQVPMKEQKQETEEEHKVEVEFNDILKRSPIIIFSKSYCPYSKRAKNILLQKYKITPAPYVVELDEHELGVQLQASLADSTGRRTVPNILVNGKSIGGGDDVEMLHEQGKLAALLKNLGGKRVMEVSAVSEDVI